MLTEAYIRASVVDFKHHVVGKGPGREAVLSRQAHRGLQADRGMQPFLISILPYQRRDRHAQCVRQRVDDVSEDSVGRG